MKQKFSIAEIFRISWKSTKSQLAILAGLLIGFCIISLTLSLFGVPVQNSVVGQIITTIISMIFSLIFILGYTKNCFQALDDIEPQFSAYGKQAPKIFTLLISNLIFSFVVLIGIILLLIPGIYLAIRLQFFTAFIVEEDAGIIESLKKSWSITKGNEMKLFLLFLSMMGIIILGIILFVVGIFVAIPLIYTMYCYSFRKLNLPLLLTNENE